MRVPEQGHRLPREAVGSLPWRHSPPAWTRPCALLWGCLLQQGWDGVISRGPFQPLPFCDSVTSCPSPFGTSICTYMHRLGAITLPVYLAGRHHRADVLQKVLQLPLKQLTLNPREPLTAEGHDLASSPLALPSVRSASSPCFRTLEFYLTLHLATL